MLAVYNGLVNIGGSNQTHLKGGVMRLTLTGNRVDGRASYLGTITIHLTGIDSYDVGNNTLQTGPQSQ
jgi:hypothetical protein